MVMVGSILNLNYSLHCDVIHQLTACQRPILVSYGICCNYIRKFGQVFVCFFISSHFFSQIEIQKVKQSRNRYKAFRKSNEKIKLFKYQIAFVIYREICKKRWYTNVSEYVQLAFKLFYWTNRLSRTPENGHMLIIMDKHLAVSVCQFSR